MKTNKDLFQHIEELPESAQKIYRKYEKYSDLTYKQCEKFLKEMEYVGYTFEYYLDAQPYDLRPIENKVILIGKFQGITSYRGEESEQSVNFDVLVEQTHLNKFGIDEEQISRFRVVAYGQEARYVREKVSTDQNIRIVGKLINNSYLNAYYNEVLSTVIESSIIDLF